MNSFQSTLVDIVDQAIASMKSTHDEWAPLRLGAVVEGLRQLNGNVMIDLDRSDRFEAALRTYLDLGASGLSTLDQLILSHGLTQTSDKLHGQSLLGISGALKDAFEGWEKLCSDPQSTVGILVWRGVLLSVFKASAFEDGLSQARAFLLRTWPSIRQNRHPPAWLKSLERHPDLFGDTPTVRYVADWLNGKQDSVDELRTAVEIPAGSWFWDDLVEAVVGRICDDSLDQSFKANLDVALDLRPQHPRLAGPILARVLDRYSSCTPANRHGRLLGDSIAAWGNPQMSLAASQHQWSTVSADTRRMICSWLAEEDLQDFDELCRRAHQVDGRRLTYWLRFRNQIAFSRLVLGDDLHYSRDVDIRKFRARKQGRLGHLSPQPSPGNNAIILQIGNWWFMEFSAIGNACYPYRKDLMTLDLGSPIHSLYELKSTRLVEASGARKLSHHADWEAKFDHFLASLGIWPDQVGVPIRRPNSTLPTSLSRIQQAGHAQESVSSSAVSAADSFWVPDTYMLPTGLVKELGEMGAKLVDSRNKPGGNCWIEIRHPRARLLEEDLRRYGFRFVPTRGFYAK